MSAKFKTLIIMPYLPLSGYIKFDNLLIWSFQKKRDDFIKNQDLKKHLIRLASCYQFRKAGAIQNPTIISTGKANFANPTAKTISKIEVLKNALLFSSVLRINQWSFLTSDNFEVFYQRFNLGEEGIAIQSGAIHKILAGGYKIEDAVFIKPDCVNIPLNSQLDGQVLKALEDCLINQGNSTAKSQILQSLNPFFNTYRNTHEISLASRVLLLIMAFELLFGESGREEFRKNILKYSTFSSNFKTKTYSYPIINTFTNKIIKNENLTLNEIWAEEFYKLRHKIIHGDTVYSDDFVFKDLIKVAKKHEPHFYIAVNFFVVCVLNKLREIGFGKVPHFVINPDSKDPFARNISGIKDETFKIVDVGIYDAFATI